WPQRDRTKTAAAAAVLLALALPGSSARAQPAPSPETLQELKRRLLEAPDCAPACASSPRMLVEATPSVLRLRMEVLAGAETAVPLPGNAQHWMPETVLVDGKPSASLWRAGNGTLWLAVAEGAHQVQMEGALPPRATVQIELPLRPHRVDAGRAPRGRAVGREPAAVAQGRRGEGGGRGAPAGHAAAVRARGARAGAGPAVDGGDAGAADDAHRRGGGAGGAAAPRRVRHLQRAPRPGRQGAGEHAGQRHRGVVELRAGAALAHRADRAEGHPVGGGVAAGRLAGVARAALRHPGGGAAGR